MLSWPSVTIGLQLTTQIHRTASFLIFLLHTPKPMYDMIWQRLLVRYDPVDHPLYDIYLGATHTTIPSTRGVQIPIDLVSSATDSFWRRVVLFKHVRIPTSDPKSEFLCQSSYIVQNLQTPWITSYAWDISHALVTTYHPYCHSPSALTEYLKHKLHAQRAKRLGRSLPAQVEPNVQPERNTKWHYDLVPLRLVSCALLSPTRSTTPHIT